MIAAEFALEKIINRDAYPIDDLDSPKTKELIRVCQRALKAEGAYVLKDFVQEEARQCMVKQANAVAGDCFRQTEVGDAYLTNKKYPDLPPDHPLRWEGTTSVGVVAYDQFPESHLMRRLYEWPALTKFLETALNRGPLYHYNCPLGAMNLAVMPAGDHVRWHFDQSNFVVSLALQQSETGGEFEYAPHIRSEQEPNYKNVQRVLEGEGRELVKTLVSPPGSLVLFEGKRTLHRVTEVTGESTRYLGLFGYVLDPNVGSSPHLKRIRYGRES